MKLEYFRHAPQLATLGSLVVLKGDGDALPWAMSRTSLRAFIAQAILHLDAGDAAVAIVTPFPRQGDAA